MHASALACLGTFRCRVLAVQFKILSALIRASGQPAHRRCAGCIRRSTQIRSRLVFRIKRDFRLPVPRLDEDSYLLDELVSMTAFSLPFDYSALHSIALHWC